MSRRLQEDQNMDEARLNLARIYKNMISWEDATKQLTILVERKFAPGDVQQMLGDIYADMGQYAEAATAYEAAILVDPTNPTNSETTSRLLMCRIETGNVEGLEELLQGVDAPGVRESTRALILAGKDEIEGALSALDLTLLENPNDLIANQTYGKIMAKSGSKEKSIEAADKPAATDRDAHTQFEIIRGRGRTGENREGRRTRGNGSAKCRSTQRSEITVFG